MVLCVTPPCYTAHFGFPQITPFMCKHLCSVSALRFFVTFQDVIHRFKRTQSLQAGYLH